METTYTTIKLVMLDADGGATNIDCDVAFDAQSVIKVINDLHNMKFQMIHWVLAINSVRCAAFIASTKLEGGEELFITGQAIEV